MPPMTRSLFILLTLLVLPCFATAEAYPSRPLTIVVGFGVGGSADRMTRAVAPFLAQELGQPVQVINKKGAGTLLAANYVLRQPDDGHTIFASAYSPYLVNTILEGSAEYTVDDFSYVNFQWFDEDLIAVNRDSRFQSLPAILDAIRREPKTVRACVVRGSTGHLMLKLLLERSGIPQHHLNLVTYNNGGPARAAVAGGVTDFIMISAKGSESIREFVRPIAINSDKRDPAWDAPTIVEALVGNDIDVPVLPGSIRGFATAAAFEQRFPERFAILTAAMRRALDDPELRQQLAQSQIGGRWVGPERSRAHMATSFETFRRYAHLLALD